MAVSNAIPLRELIATWDDGLVTPADGDSILDRVGIVDFGIAERSEVVTLSLTVAFDGELELAIPGVEGLAVVLGAAGQSTVLAAEADLTGPFAVRLPDLSAALRLPAALLHPAERQGDTWVVVTESDGSPATYEIALSGAAVTLDGDGNLTLGFPSGSPAIGLAPLMIGETGLVIESTAVELILSGQAPLPADAPAGFKGLVVEAATLHLPDGLASAVPTELRFAHCYIGTGGFSGSVAYTGGTLAGDLFGLAFTLEGVELAFVQNSITAGAIAGTLTLPFFEAPLGVAIGIGLDGGVQVEISDPTAEDGIVAIPVGGVGTVQINSLELDIADTAAIVIGGMLIPGELAGLSLPTVAIDGLRIGADGSVAVEGAGLTLQDQAVVDLYGFQMEITAVTVGSEERDGSSWNWFGLSGGIRLADGLPVGVSAKGVRLLWERGGSRFAVECDGVGVSFAIPGVLSIDGAVSLVDQEFVGGVVFKLTTLDLVVDASLIAGRTQDSHGDAFSYFKVELDASLPLGIPLGCTGLAFYGFGGLFASNMVPDQAGGSLDGDELDWYAHWYESWDQPWAAQRGALGIGVGVTLGTLADNGFTFAKRVALVFSFPGPIIMLQGVGNILRPRSSLPDDSTFTALILFDGAGGELLAALGMSYALPAEGALAGRLLEAGGTAEAYFDLNDADNWHIYLGEAPPERRIRASVLEIFQADAYLMLEKPELKTGTSIGYTAGWDFEVVAVTLSAWMAGEAALSWAPQHLAGSLDFGGEVAVRAFGFGLGLRVEAGVAVETPTPYHLELDLTVSLDLPWPLDDLEIDINLEWSEAAEPSAEDPVLHEASVRAYVTTDAWSLPLTPDPNIANDDRFYPSQDGQVLTVPLDARPTVVFNRNVEDAAGVGTPRPAVAPEVVESEENGRHEFRYRLTGLILQKWAVSEFGIEEWTGDVDVTDPASGATVKGLEVYGSWQATGDAAGTQLELYGDGPFSFCRDTASMGSGLIVDAPPWTPWVDGFLSTRPTYPAVTLEVVAVDFEAFATSQNVGRQLVHAGLTFESGADIFILDMSAVGGRMSIVLRPLVSLFIRFPEPVGRLALTFLGWSVSDNFPARWAVVRGTLAGGATVLQAVDLGPPPAEGVVREVELDDRFAEVTSLELRGFGAFLLRVSYVTAAQLDAVDDLVEDGERAIEPRPLLLPETDYRLTIQTETVATTSAGTTSQVQYAFFRTSGPPTDLTPYLAATIPEHGGGPHFGAYDLRFELNQNYVKDMYGAGLTLRLVDDNGEEVAAADGSALMTLAGSGISAMLPYTTLAWLGALTDAELLEIGRADPAENDVLVAEPAGTSPLPGGRRLEARLVYDGSTVLALPFTTSHYADFTALIGAFAPTVWDETLLDGMPTATGQAELQAIATERAAATGPFADAEGEQHDRVLYDLLGCDTRPLPVQPELTALRANGDIVALLLELPDPLEWDRLSLTIRARRRAVGAVIVRGIDRTRAVLLVPGQTGEDRPAPWAPGTYALTFAYQLDTGDGALPVLTRRGSSRPEEPAAVRLVVSESAGPVRAPSRSSGS